MGVSTTVYPISPILSFAGMFVGLMGLRLLVHDAIMGAFALFIPQSSKTPATTSQSGSQTTKRLSALSSIHILRLLELWVLYRNLLSVHLCCIAYHSWAMCIDRSPFLLVPGFPGSGIFVTRRSGGHSNDYVSNDGHSMARALNLCLFTYIENILDGYLFGYRLSHRLRTV